MEKKLTRAEAAAMKAYPEEKHPVCGPLPGGDIHEFDDNAGLRKVYIEGYEQAEKDLALSWKDMLIILNIIMRVYDKHLFDGSSEQEICEEALKEFNEYKEAKK